MPQIVLYVSTTGHTPFQKWFDRLDAKAAERVKRAIDRLEVGNPGDSKPVGNGVSERRIDYGPGYRVYLGIGRRNAGGPPWRGDEVATIRRHRGRPRLLVRLQEAEKGNLTMPLTKPFTEVVKERAQRDPDFRAALLSGAIECLAENDVEAARKHLRDYVNATIGFEELARQMGGASSKSLMRMLSTEGNPRMENLGAMIAVLKQHEGIVLRVESIR